LNDDYHSKPMTKANGVVRRQLQAVAADDDLLAVGYLAL
jgi:hypothetical protein